MFRNRQFLEWLRYTKKYDLHISIIAYVETLLWYKAMGLVRKDFDDELEGVEVIELSKNLSDRITANALKYGRAFPFRHHARDYVIGTTALENKATLITYNLDDFGWVPEEGGAVDSPENFLLKELR